MAETSKVATYALELKSNAGDVSAQQAEELERLRGAIQKSQDSLKGYGAALRSLRGTSEEVAEAKVSLRSKIDAERGAVSAANLALLKQGQTYEKLTAEMKATEAAQRKLDQKKAAAESKKQAEALRELADAAKKPADAFRTAGGPLGDLVGKLDTLKGVASGAGGGMGIMALAVGGAVAAVAALGFALADATIKTTTWALSSANALRTMGLMREAVGGSAKNAQALGEQVDAMSSKLSTSKEKLNDLATSLTKALSGGVSRASPEVMGRTIVSTFEAVSRASDAMGDDVGRQIQGIITRGKMLGRMRLTAFDLEGTQVQFQEVAEALAKNMKVGVKEAQDALINGRVAVDDGAKAMADAVNKRFGDINARKMLDLGVIADKLGEKWRALTKNIPVEKIGQALKSIVDLFDETSFEGQQIEKLFGDMGAELGDSMKGAVPIVREAIDQVILSALKLELAFYQTRKAMGGKDAFNASTLTTAKDMLTDLGTAAWDVAKAVIAIAKAWGEWDKLARAGSLSVPISGDIGRAQENAEKKLADWKKDHPGMRNPILEQRIEDVKGHAKGGMIGKPDKGEIFVSAKPGEVIVPAGMMLVPRGGGGGGAGFGGGVLRVEVRHSVEARGGGEHAAAIVAEMRGGPFLFEFSKALRQTLVAAGVPTQGSAGT